MDEKELLSNLDKISFSLDKIYIRRIKKDFETVKFEAYNNYPKREQEEKPNQKILNDNLSGIRIKRWVYDKEEKIVDRFKNILSVFAGESTTLALVIRRLADKSEVSFWVKNENPDGEFETISSSVELLKKAILGNFPGTEIEDIPIWDEDDKHGERFADSVSLPCSNLSLQSSDTQDKNGHSVGLSSIACLTSVPSEKSEDYTCQGIEKLLDGIAPDNEDDSYNIVILAEPIQQETGVEIQNGYEELASALFPYSGHQFSTGTSKTETSGEFKSLAHSQGINRSITKTNAINVGVNGSVHLGTPGAGGSIGMSAGFSHSRGDTEGSSEGDTKSSGTNYNLSDASSENTTYNYRSYGVSQLVDKLEKQLKRIENGKALGLWNCASYVLAKNAAVSLNVANFLRALTQGDESNLETVVINNWLREDDETAFNEIEEYLLHLTHPVFQNIKDKEVSSDKKEVSSDKFDILTITPATILSTTELSHIMSFPHKSVAGLPAYQCAAFGRNVSSLDAEKTPQPKTEVGEIWHMRHADGGKVELDTNLLTSHVFITGSTGSGKSNTVYQLLDKLTGSEAGVEKKFLVVEPTKGEYKTIFGGRPGVSVYGTNYKATELLRINPFSFPEGVQLYAHLDRLIEIFNACWPMYAAMPAVLKDAMERAYVDAGWNLATSENPYGRLFPNFIDVLRQIDVVMNESDYSGDSKGDYKGALKTRLKSLTNGIYSQIFTGNELPEKKLFDENVIVDLSEIGNETTSLIMGVLVLKLQEYRMASKAINSELKHVTVLEEAHNLLKRTSTEQSAEGSNLAGKSVEMITNAIAEMRTYGECFMIVDQAPGALDPAAIRNTNTKIVLRLPDFSDRELVGKAIGLNDYQISELSKLERGVAAVYQSGWIESVLCHFEEYTKKEGLLYDMRQMETDRSVAILLNAVLNGAQVNEFADALKRMKHILVEKSNLPVSLKRIIIDICNNKEQPVSEKELGKIAYTLLDGDNLFAGDKEPGEKDIARQLSDLCRKNQIDTGVIKQNNITILMLLLQQ